MAEQHEQIQLPEDHKVYDPNALEGEIINTPPPETMEPASTTDHDPGPPPEPLDPEKFKEIDPGTRHNVEVQPPPDQIEADPPPSEEEPKDYGVPDISPEEMARLGITPIPGQPGKYHIGHGQTHENLPLYEKLRQNALQNEQIHLNCTVFTEKTPDGKGICTCRTEEGYLLADHWTDELMKQGLDEQIGQFLKPDLAPFSEMMFARTLRLSDDLLRAALK